MQFSDIGLIRTFNAMCQINTDDTPSSYRLIEMVQNIYDFLDRLQIPMEL